MLRIAYAVCVVSLLGASAVAGTGIENRKDRLGDNPHLLLVKLRTG